MSLDLSLGWRAASARVEWREAGSGAGAPEAQVALQGWIDRGALGRLEATLAELSRRGVRRLLLDCAGVRHVEFGAVPALAALLARVAPAGLRLRGMSPHLRDLFRLAGCPEMVPSVLSSGGLAALSVAGPRREWAT